MLTPTEWDRLSDLRCTADHIHYYANQVYAKQNSVEPHILHTLKCLSKLSRREQHDWYILEDVVYYLPAYQKTYHKYQAGDAPLLTSDSLFAINKMKYKPEHNAHSSD